MKFEKVTTTPTAPYTEGAVYLVAAGKEHFEMLAVTKDKQKVRRTINTADVDERINKAISELGALEIVANIAARDALSLSANAMVLVLDASADSTVKAGGGHMPIAILTSLGRKFPRLKVWIWHCHGRT